MRFSNLYVPCARVKVKLDITHKLRKEVEVKVRVNYTGKGSAELWDMTTASVFTKRKSMRVEASSGVFEDHLSIYIRATPYCLEMSKYNRRKK